MGIYHFSLKTIGRANGRSAVASAAYISGTRLYSQETGLTYNYRKKKEVVFRHIFLPENAPEEYKDRETLWNAVQKIEKRSDARLARTIDVALPREFDRDLRIRILGKYVEDRFVSKGMCADVAIHDKGDGNPHAHIMLTTRGFNPDGSWSKKEKSVYKLDASGNKIPMIDPETGRQKVRVRKGKGTEKLWQRESIPSNDWNKRENVETWREAWSEICNLYLDQSQRIDHRSYKRQGLDLEPTIHEGYAARQMEEKGLVSERAEYNRGVKERNRLRQEIRRKVEELYQNIMEKAREIYGRIKGYLDFDEKGGSPSEPSRRRRQIAVRTAERKRRIMETESFLEERIGEGRETDQGISRTGRSIDQTERRLSETEWDLTRTESEIDSIEQRIDQQHDENERRFREIMKRHDGLIAADKVRVSEATRLQNRESERRDPISTIFNRGGEAYATGYDDKATVRTGRGIPEQDRKTEWDYPETRTKDQGDGSPLSGEGSRDRKPGGCNHVEGSPDKNAGTSDQRKRGHFQYSKQIDRRSKKEDQRVGGETAESVTPKKSTVVRKKKRVKEDIGPRL